MAKKNRGENRKSTAIDYSEAVDAFARKLAEIRANIERIVDEDWASPSLREIDSFLVMKQSYETNDGTIPEPVQDAIWRAMWQLVADHGRGWWA